jgi:hypothetical protein
MPQGLQLFNSAGGIQLDATDNIAKFLGVAYIGTSYTGATVLLWQ